MLEEKINQEKTIKEKIRELKKAVIRPVIYTALAISLASGFGCGPEKSYCCKQFVCNADYFCIDREISTTIAGVMCIKDNIGNNIECCECSYYPLPNTNPPCIGRMC